MTSIKNINPLMNTNKKEEILMKINELLEKAKQISLKEAGNQFYPYYQLHVELCNSKKNCKKFSKELSELLAIRDNLDLVFKRYNLDPRAPTDFIYLMENYLKYLHKVDAFKLYKLNLKIKKNLEKRR